MRLILVRDCQYVVETPQEDPSWTDYFAGMLQLKIRALFASLTFYLASHVAVAGGVEVCLVVVVIPWPLNRSRYPVLSNTVPGLYKLFSSAKTMLSCSQVARVE